MEDAVILANAIYEIRAVNSENITTAFQDYYEERYPHAVEQLKFSKLFTMLMAGQVRKKYILLWIWKHWGHVVYRTTFPRTI